MPLRSAFLLALFLPVMLSAQDLLFEERFTAGQLGSAWRAGFNGNSMEVESMLGNPSGDGWVGKLGNHFSGGNVGATHTVARFSDFYYEAKVFIPVHDGVYYGLEFRVDTSGLSSGYQFVARFQPGGMVTPRLRFRLRPSDNPGMPAVIRDWEAGDIPGGIPTEDGWHTLGVRAQGHRFWFYYDGQMLPGSPILDFTSLEGSVGAYLWDASSPLLNLYIDDIEVWSDIPTGIEDPAARPEDLRIVGAYPQPASGSVQLLIETERAQVARVHIVDVLGREAGQADHAIPGPGRHVIRLEHGNYPALRKSGIYFLSVETASGRTSTRLIVR